MRVPARRQVHGDAADAEERRVHAGAGDRLHDAMRALAIGEHVEDRRHLADVLGHGAVEQQMVGDAEEFAEHDADDLRARRAR